MAEYAVVLAVITPALILAFATMADAIVARLQTVVAFLLAPIHPKLRARSPGPFFTLLKKRAGRPPQSRPCAPMILVPPGA